jgi:DNA modification methylase
MIEYRIGDVFERMAEIPDGSIDLIVTSPPFLALRSYLPADHPDKAKEIGSEATPAEFIDTLLALSAEWGRVLAPHGSLCVELGDTYSGSGGAGGDYNAGGLRDGQEAFSGSASRKRTVGSREHRTEREGTGADGGERVVPINAGPGWPLAKSLTGIPTLYPWSLAYGRNLLTGQPSPAGQWRIRNVIVWARPNPPVGALGDKFRPATSYITVACRGTKRYFDLDAVRGEVVPENARTSQGMQYINGSPAGARAIDRSNHAGAPPLDWHTDHHPEDGDWLWKMSTQPYAGSHYATFPMALPKRLIEAMCPLRVCRECGKPSERIVGEAEYVSTNGGRVVNQWAGERRNEATNQWEVAGGNPGHAVRSAPTLGWSDCGHNQWRTGVVLDPFAGSGTTLEAAQAVGRHAIGIDLDHRNADLAQQRVGMFLEIDDGGGTAHVSTEPHNQTSLNNNPRFRAGYLVRDGRKTPQAKDYESVKFPADEIAEGRDAHS